MGNKSMVGLGKNESYTIMGVDWTEKKGPLPLWGWGLIGAGAVYYFFVRK